LQKKSIRGGQVIPFVADSLDVAADLYQSRSSFGGDSKTSPKELFLTSFTVPTFWTKDFLARFCLFFPLFESWFLYEKSL
jgi:hypothetical protein